MRESDPVPSFSYAGKHGESCTASPLAPSVALRPASDAFGLHLVALDSFEMETENVLYLLSPAASAQGYCNGQRQKPKSCKIRMKSDIFHTAKSVQFFALKTGIIASANQARVDRFVSII